MSPGERWAHEVTRDDYRTGGNQGDFTVEGAEDRRNTGATQNSEQTGGGFMQNTPTGFPRAGSKTDASRDPISFDQPAPPGLDYQATAQEAITGANRDFTIAQAGQNVIDNDQLPQRIQKGITRKYEVTDRRLDHDGEFGYPTPT